MTKVDIAVYPATWKKITRLFVVWLGIVGCSGFAHSQSDTQTDGAANSQTLVEALKKLDSVVEQNHKLETQNHELMDQVNSLRRVLAKQVGVTTEVTPEANQKTNDYITSPEDQGAGEGEGPTLAEEKIPGEGENTKWGKYTPNFGYKVADTEHGDLSISIYTYFRYLNQLALNPTYTNAFGATSTIQQRQDYQLNKLQIKFLGWLWHPKFHYYLWAWTSNSNMGQGAQVVLAGNIGYKFSKYFDFSVGVTSLPGTRSVEGNFPMWLSVDSRLIADEFFRPSYTQGFWAKGDLTRTLRYQAMIGTNTSILGVNAGQLTNHPTTFASALVWMPTTGEFGPGFGDFEHHQKLATRLAAHFTRSREDKQSQPGTEVFDNTQIRLSDGTIIFTPDIFGQGITVNTVTYKMASFDGGIKYHGYSLEGEYFLRWLGNFAGVNTASVPSLFDHGFQLQTSAMLVPKTLQLYAGGSAIFGKYGSPWDTRIGLSYYPWKNRVLRWVNEGLYLRNSPVGYFAVPFVVGGNGWVFHSNLELAF